MSRLEQDEMDRVLARSVAAMLAAARALPHHEDLDAELERVEAASSRGYFLPDPGVAPPVGGQPRGQAKRFPVRFPHGGPDGLPEVVYRGFRGIGPVKFHLEEVGGCLCLPAEEFVMQAMDGGFRIVAFAGLRGDRLLTGVDAELAFHDSRQSWQA